MDAGLKLAIFHDQNAIHDYKLDSFGILRRFLECRSISDRLWIEDGEVGIGAGSNAAFVFH